MKPWVLALLVCGIIIVAICYGEDKRNRKAGNKGVSCMGGLLLLTRFVFCVTAFVLLQKFIIDLFNTVYPRP